METKKSYTPPVWETISINPHKVVCGSDPDVVSNINGNEGQDWYSE